MEEWEQFFAEKSRRRRDVVERRKRTQTLAALITAGMMVIAIGAMLYLMD